MDSKKRNLVIAISLSAVTAPAVAQLGGLGGLLGGGGKGGGAGDPKKIETDLKNIIEATSIALAKLAAALGLKESAAKMEKNALDIKSGSVGLADSTNVVSDQCVSVKAEMEKNKREGIKLSAEAAAIGSQAILPAIKSFPLWKSVWDGGKSLDTTSLLGFTSLAAALPRVPTAAKNSLEMYQAGIAYLSFSGADTTAIQKEAEAALKF